MAQTHQVIKHLAMDGFLEISQKGQVITDENLMKLRGPYRIRKKM
jgi:hypothetical protein